MDYFGGHCEKCGNPTYPPHHIKIIDGDKETLLKLCPYCYEKEVLALMEQMERERKTNDKKN